MWSTIARASISRKLFACARLLGYEDVELRHVSFGTVLGEDKRPYRTRSGDVVGLEGLLDEAIRRAYKVVSENDDSKPNGAELSEEQRQAIARTVGHAASSTPTCRTIEPATTCSATTRWWPWKATRPPTCNTPTHARRASLQRGDVDIDALRAAQPQILLQEPAERDLALELLQLGDALDKMLDDYRPNVLTAYLFSLASKFSRFYENCDVLKADSQELRDSRLLLCDLTGRTIRQGLALLGIGVVDKM